MGRNRSERLLQPLLGRIDESRMVEEWPDLVDLRSVFDFVLRTRDVLPVLPASGIRTEGGSHESQSPPDSVVLHLPYGVGEQRMPIAVSPIDGQLWTMLLKFLLEGGNQ